ncbi:MAG: amino acid permease [Halobacteria archaeon]|nr:amino acid permease [Halobacteria archaeon]
MSKDLERDLGLYATITISIGAMIGSGIFVLPGLAAEIAGPAVILAYFLAGLIVLPAALSKAEMGTAMPEAGGTYLYIDRAMGPLPGTIAGIGAWFSLVFKSAFALVGLGAYLLIFIDISIGATKFVALGLGVLLILVNIIGVKQSGRLQALVVTLVLLALILFVADGITFVDQPRYHPFFKQGFKGLLAATGFVFVSYAGVTKIASVAEEVEDPGRNLPLGILISIGLMMFIYTFVVFVIIGVTPIENLEKSLRPMAVAADRFFGGVGGVAISVVAALALTSMANAGILSSSRFPFAMSRDALAPDSLGRVSKRFKTPIYAISFTGGVLLVLIAFIPVIELAKLASAFQILVFTFENAALIAFRESDLESYDPKFVAPGYPWVQLSGIFGSLAILGALILFTDGLLPLIGAIGIILGGIAWYRVYGRERTEREGAALDAIRRTTGDYSIDRIERMFKTGGQGGVMVAVGPGTDFDSESTLLRIAEVIAKRRGGQIETVRFEEVPEQTTLSTAATEQTPEDQKFERETSELVRDFAVPVNVEEVVSHDIENAVINHAENTGVNLIIGEWQPEFFHGELLGRDVDWYIKNAPCDLLFVRDHGLDEINDIVVVADKGPYDPLEVLVADAIAHEYDATIRFVHSIDEGATEDQANSIKSYQNQLRELCTAPTESRLIRTGDRGKALFSAAEDGDITVVGTSAHHLLYDVMFGAIPDTLATELDSTVLLVHSYRPRRHTFLRYLLERFVF